MLNTLFDTDDNYKNMIFENGYDQIKIVKDIHCGFRDAEHFIGIFISWKTGVSTSQFHFYTENNKIIKISQIQLTCNNYFKLVI